jgi:hypothetical protein
MLCIVPTIWSLLQIALQFYLSLRSDRSVLYCPDLLAAHRVIVPTNSIHSSDYSMPGIVPPFTYPSVSNLYIRLEINITV